MFNKTSSVIETLRKQCKRSQTKCRRMEYINVPVSGRRNRDNHRIMMFLAKAETTNQTGRSAVKWETSTAETEWSSGTTRWSRSTQTDFVTKYPQQR